MTTVSTENAKVIPVLGQSGDRFGSGVAISGNKAIVGAPGRDNGYAYTYEFDGSTWITKQTLTASDIGDSFGGSVSMSGNYAIIGDPNNLSYRGSAYIFEFDGTTWTETQLLLASDGAGNDKFATSVSISNNYAIVGAHNKNSIGAAYIFERDTNGNWTEAQKLVSSDIAYRDDFGIGVAISGNYAVVGAKGDDDKANGSGSAYIFERDTNGIWTETQKLVASDGAYVDMFGFSVGISDNYIIVGRDYNGNVADSNNDKGSVYIFERDVNGSWGTSVPEQTYRTETQKLVASDGADTDRFGYSVAISGNYAAVGAFQDDDVNTNTGSVYLFQRDENGTWTEVKKLLASDAAYVDKLGWSVSISNDYVIAGSVGDNSNRGGAYIYQTTPSIPEEEQSLIDLNIETTDIDVLKSVSFSNKSNGRGEPGTTSRAKIKSLITGENDATNKRRKRRAALKLLFSKDTDVTKMIIPKEDLQLPDGFNKTNALVVKAGESFNINELGADEGFYSVLDDGESVDIVTENTTLTFTRNDDINDNELYEVSAADWTDIVINSDNVSSGTFTDENNTGTLAPDDSVTIDGRVFIIGSVADGGTGGSGGDPYVFPLKSNTPVKLPNKPAVYRMFEQGDNYVNVEVGRVTDEHKQRMFQYASQITPVTHNIVLDGYFYQKAFISAEGHKLTIDYTTKKANCNEESAKFFSMKQSKKLFDCGEFKEDANCWTVGWTTKENKKIQVQLMFFPNPHIENGINVIPSTLKNSTGLIVDNFKPKLMELPSLTTEKFGKLHRKLSKAKNIHQKMSIKGKNEKWHFN